MQPLDETQPFLAEIPAEGPFSLQDEKAYREWREAKLNDYPSKVTDLVVGIDDPFALSEDEKNRLLALCRKTNMAVFQLQKPCGDPADKAQVKNIGKQLGLFRLDSNLCADDDDITSLTVVSDGRHKTYIPYSNRPISWHTDGYYNPLDKQIRGLLLHCVTPAARGGENDLLDHEIAYIHLRDTNPAYIAALMQPDAMTIPPNEEHGTLVRGPSPGPVFSVDSRQGFLHMRYTARTRSIEWKKDGITEEAAACLSEFLNSDSPYIFHHRLQSGQGLISNNVLHTRSGFEDDEARGIKRLLYRARYFDRISDT